MNKGASIMKNDSISELLLEVRTKHPLVHNITNLVVTNIVANALLAIGASPVMAYANEEVGDVALASAAVALNMGTLDSRIVNAMEITAHAANEGQVPVVFDPVGAGFTPYRNEVATKMINKYDLAVIRGNTAEIGFLVGAGGTVKGVDAIGVGDSLLLRMVQYARIQHCVIVATGETDYVTDGRNLWSLRNGHSLLATITGSGCMLTGIIGAFVGVIERDASLLSIAHTCIAAITCYNVAGEIAAQTASGPGTFQVALFDALYHLSGDTVSDLAKVELVM